MYPQVASNQGQIKVIHSPYENLDENQKVWFCNLKKVWAIWRKSANVTSMLYDYFAASPNPYVSVLQMMCSCTDFYTCKPNTLSYNIMENFSTWIEGQRPMVVQYPGQQLKIDAFNLVIKQKNMSLMKITVKAFDMEAEKELFVPAIKDLLSSNMLKEACQCAVMLQLHSHFSIEQLIIPLIFQDKFSVAEEFLADSPQHQRQVVVFLDNLLGAHHLRQECQSIIELHGIQDAKVDKLYYKPLSKLVARLIKIFNLPPETCPVLTKKRGMGALQFLLHKRYVERNIGDDSWAEMALEAVGSNEMLHEELVIGVATFGELKEALGWAERFGLPMEKWPLILQDYIGSGCTKQGENTSDNEPAAASTVFHTLQLSEEQVFLVDTEVAFAKFLAAVQCSSVIGIDSEWKPSFSVKKCDVALIQIATWNAVFILDVIVLGRDMPLWRELAQSVLANQDILKLGFGLASDLTMMADCLPALYAIRLSGHGFLDLALLWKSLSNFKLEFPHSPPPSSASTSESLGRLVELCLGELLDKSDQFSNWERRPLRKSQIVYAALDSFCLLEVYQVLRNEAESQGIAFIDVVNELMTTHTTPKKSKRKKTEKHVVDVVQSAGPNIDRVLASEVRLLCDTMLTGLGKQLRICGVDTVVLAAGDEPSAMQAEGRHIVTRASRCQQLSKYGHVYCVQSDDVHVQLEEVVSHFNIGVASEDIFSRCLDCNTNELEIFSQADLMELQGEVPTTQFEEQHSDKPQVIEGAAGRGRTTLGARIQVELVPPGVFQQVTTFFVCAKCGKCYWHGGHHKRTLQAFTQFLQN